MMGISVAFKVVGGPTTSVSLEVEPDKTTVGDMKRMISEKYPEISPARMKIIYSGAVLEDGSLVGAEGVTPKDGGHFVLFVSKNKGGGGGGGESAPAAPPATPAPGAVVPPTPAAPQIQRSTGAAALEAARPAAGMQAPLPATGNLQGGNVEPDSETVALLMGMGFPEDRVRNALSAAFNNPDVAANFLFTEIPPPTNPSMDTVEGSGAGGGIGLIPMDDVDRVFPSHHTAALDSGGVGAWEETGGGNLTEDLDPVHLMRSHPDFGRIRNLIRNNPGALQDIMSELQNQASGLELLSCINENPQAFIQLINETDGEGDLDESAMHAEDLDLGAALGGDSEATVLSAEEEQAVQNIMAIVPSASREQVVEAYLSCDKNQELAVNLLFDSM